MKLLPSTREHRDIWLVPVQFLTPLYTFVRPKPEDLWEDIDANGMRNPLVCWPMTAGMWARWSRSRPQAQSVVPRFVLGHEPMETYAGVDYGAAELAGLGLIWAVKTGNQRLAYAEARNYTHVSAVLCESHAKAVEWSRHNCK